MGKAKKIFFGTIGGILVFMVALYFYASMSSTNVAILNIESGNVMVDKGNGLMSAMDGMKLKLNNIIKTGDDGEASVVLYESAIVSLKPNTEIRIADLDKDNIRIQQSSGSTWNKFTGLLGLTGMSIETPDTVATVRGTSFGVNLTGVFVGEGKVWVNWSGEDGIVEQGEAMDWSKGKLIKRNLTAQEKAIIIIEVKKHIEVMKDIRMDEIEKKKFIITQLLNANNLSYSELPDYLEEIDSGEGEMSEISGKIPIKLDSLQKILDMTGKVREEKQLIEWLSAK